MSGSLFRLSVRALFVVCFVISNLSLSAARAPFGQEHRTEAEEHAHRGLQLAQAGDLGSAETELRRAVDLAPKNPVFLSDLGTILAMEKKLEDSTGVFKQALKLDPHDLTARRYLAANLWQLRRYPEAKQNLDVILREKPGDEPTLLLLGMVSENTNNYAEAVKALASVPALVRERPEAMAALARAYYHVGETQKARGVLQELLTHADSQGIFLGAQIAHEMRDYDTAEKLLVSIQSSFPDKTAVGYSLALAQFDAKRYAESQQTLLGLLDTGFKTSEIYNLLGWCYHKQNQPGEEARAFEEAINLGPNKEANYLDFVEVLVAGRSLPMALSVARRMTKVFPESPRAFRRQGLVEFAMGQFTDAIGSFTRAVQLDPATPDGPLGLAQAQAAAGMIAEATATFEAGIRRFPKAARFKLEYARLLLKEAETGNPLAETHATQLLHSALAIDGSLSDAHYELGSLALRRGPAAEALPHLEAAARLDPASAKIHFALSRAYKRLDRANDAAREMQRYEELKKNESQRPVALLPSGASPD